MESWCDSDRAVLGRLLRAGYNVIDRPVPTLCWCWRVVCQPRRYCRCRRCRYFTVIISLTPIGRPRSGCFRAVVIYLSVTIVVFYRRRSIVVTQTLATWLSRTLVSLMSTSTSRLQQFVEEIHRWCAFRRIQLNPSKTEVIWFSMAANLKKIKIAELALLLPVTSFNNPFAFYVISVCYWTRNFPWTNIPTRWPVTVSFNSSIEARSSYALSQDHN